MMCEHEFVFGRINATHCKRRNDTEQEIILREQLAAANTRMAELEAEINNYLSFGQGGASFSDSQWLDMLAKTEQRAEQAEAQNKRMQTAINRYVIGNIELLDALKAALEVKP